MSELALFEDIAPRFDGPLSVREVTPETARRWIINWHYSHRMPLGSAVAYGAFAPDLVAVITLSTPTNAHGVARRLGLADLPGNREISRVVAHPDAPKNTCSRAIAACAPLWRGRGFLWVYSYADTGQGHHGGIYQALNAAYMGVTPARHGFIADGVPMHPRSVVQRWGTESWPTVRALAEADGVELARVKGANGAKHLYILPVGRPAERRAIRKMLAPRARAYPKRGSS